MEGVLEREMYSVSAAARLLKVPDSTLWYWLDGDKRGYRPIIRPDSTGVRSLSWGEFVSAYMLRKFRRENNFDLREIRDLVDGLRTELGVPFPLAEERTYEISGGHVVERIQELQESTGTPADLRLITKTGNQYLLTPPSEEFVKSVRFERGEVMQIRPNDKIQRVVIDPDVRFGRPAVKGISTAVLLEYHQSGADDHEIAEIFGLPLVDIRSAVRFELALAA